VKSLHALATAQQQRNQALLKAACHLGDESIASQVLPLHLDIAALEQLSPEQVHALEGLQVEAACIAIRSLASLARINELDHLGGGLELIPSLLMSLAVSDYERVEYTIEHAHTSIGYFSCLAALGFIDPQLVVDGFRRGLDIPGHVSWLPGGTQLNGGRLGVMVPVAVGQALGKRAFYGQGSWVLAHCGDAGWISGQALNGFNGASLHGAPITFVMHRNGIQLSGATRNIMDRDPRRVIGALGIEILEIPTLHDTAALYQTYRRAFALAQEGKPSLIYPVGWRSNPTEKVTLRTFGERFGVLPQLEAFAGRHQVPMDREVWIPGSLMSFRDVIPMIECLFLVNQLPGGEGHHDGHMKGRVEEEVLAGPLLQQSPAQQQALGALRRLPPRIVVTQPRPAPGAPNLVLPAEALEAVKLPAAGSKASPRAGSEAGYEAVARAFPERVFVVSCDLDVSTRLARAGALLPKGHRFEMSIEEQAAALMADGLAMSTRQPQLNVVSTFAAFFEGIAREGFELWRYQRNLNGINEGLNVTFHLSHVGSCTGRDHFSGWSLDWINMGLTYLPYLRRFYAPADARAAFLAVRDLAAHYGGHVLAIARDNLPVLDRQDGTGPLWEVHAAWEETTQYRAYAGARRAILAIGAPAYLAGEAAAQLEKEGLPVDVHIANSLPLPQGALEKWIARYDQGLVTIEDGLIGTPDSGLRGFAGLVASAAQGRVPLAHLGIADPRIAPSEGHPETWAYFGLTTQALAEAVKGL
jgi:transketolase N-terminal domain/subunit/transketolase C-terminal domain/subunit